MCRLCDSYCAVILTVLILIVFTTIDSKLDTTQSRRNRNNSAKLPVIMKGKTSKISSMVLYFEFLQRNMYSDQLCKSFTDF